MPGRTFEGGTGGLGKTCGYILGAFLVLAHAFDDQEEGFKIPAFCIFGVYG